MPFTAWSSPLTSVKKVPDQFVFNGFGCHGKNISPPLEWSEAPPETQSFAVTLHDPDAPKSGGWWHWTVVNIPASVTKIEEGASNENRLPKNAVELKTDFGDVHYGGPCPPAGDAPHHYVFTVYALKRKSIPVTTKTTPASIKRALEEESIAKSSFVVEYAR